MLLEAVAILGQVSKPSSWCCPKGSEKTGWRGFNPFGSGQNCRLVETHNPPFFHNISRSNSYNILKSKHMEIPFPSRGTFLFVCFFPATQVFMQQLPSGSERFPGLQTPGSQRNFLLRPTARGRRRQLTWDHKKNKNRFETNENI